MNSQIWTDVLPRRIPAVLASSLGMFACCASNAAHAYTLKTLYSFYHLTDCVDGNTPSYGLLLDDKGNLFGVAGGGGAYEKGVVFQLIPAKKGKWKYQVLYSFCPQSHCADGAGPDSQLILDKNGNLYGTTGVGGLKGHGTVFELARNGSVWTETVLYSFCDGGSACPDGRTPFGALAYTGQSSGALYDGSSSLFGTTVGGGEGDRGVAYALKHNGSWSEQVLHAFNPASEPFPPVLDNAGNLYGVTQLGGVYGSGRVYRLDADRAWHQVVLCDFCAQSQCLDGAYPAGRLLFGAGGTLIGTTQGGGVADRGVAFSLRSDGSNHATFYNFCSKSDCSDGSGPTGDLDMDAAGDLFGTTSAGGLQGYGTVFRLRHKAQWSEEVLYKFCAKSDCKDGAVPTASVIHDKKGNLFGTTQMGGMNEAGTVFELTP